MARYLSDEWFADAAALLDGADGATAAGESAAGATGPGGDALVVEQHVDDAPGGPTVWHVVVAEDRRSIHAGPHAAPTVTFHQDYATAAAVARGELSAQEAFMTGRITLSGKVGALMAATPALAALGDALAPLRDSTSY